MDRPLLRFRRNPWRRRVSCPGLTVSVVVNTLNRASSLRRTLDALATQQYDAFEVIVVNGPSTDETTSVLAEFSGRARILFCAEASVGRSRNIGVAHAAGDVVAFIDDDAVPPTNWLDLLIAEYDSDEVGGVGGPVFDVPLARVEWRICTSTRLGHVTADDQQLADDLTRPGADPFFYLAGCNMSFRRSVLAEIGGFNGLLAYGYDDVDVCRAVIDAGYHLRHAEHAVVRHDRAPSPIRDGQQVLRDPYPIIHARAVFSLQCPGPHSADDVATAVNAWADGWRSVADGQRAAGVLTDQEHAEFSARARQGAIDGLAAGATPRTFESLPRPPRHAFQPYHR